MQRVNGANATVRVHLLRPDAPRGCVGAAATRRRGEDERDPRRPQLCGGLDLTNVVVTMDALLTPHASRPRRRQHRALLLVVKDNQPTLAADIARASLLLSVARDHFATSTTWTKRHGRLETPRWTARRRSTPT